MTRDEARQLLPIIQAYAEGKTVQKRYVGQWVDIPAPDFIDREPDRYRIKPEPIECWAVVYRSGYRSSLLHDTEASARESSAAEEPGSRVIRMREV